MKGLEAPIKGQTKLLQKSLHCLHPHLSVVVLKMLFEHQNNHENIWIRSFVFHGRKKNNEKVNTKISISRRKDCGASHVQDVALNKEQHSPWWVGTCSRLVQLCPLALLQIPVTLAECRPFPNISFSSSMNCSLSLNNYWNIGFKNTIISWNSSFKARRLLCWCM